MTQEESGKLLELIQLAYPHSYRDLDEAHMLATVRMWAASFPQVPYPLIEQCFDRYRMENRHPPTVADINLELKTIRREAETAMRIQRQLGNREMEAHFQKLLAATQPETGTLLLCCERPW